MLGGKQELFETRPEAPLRTKARTVRPVITKEQRHIVQRKYHILIPIALVTLLVDQITKHFVTTMIPPATGFEVVSGFFNLVHARNPGAAFGILADLGPTVRALFFGFISLAAAGVIFWVIAAGEKVEVFLLLGCSFFLGGVLGNSVDRMRFGEVIDFLDVYLYDWHWPAFNVADSALCVGTACFFIHYLFRAESRAE
ncbi:MAG: signal peptidase II [Pseudomonadota bacterium]